jgi:hypothetical protein
VGGSRIRFVSTTIWECREVTALLGRDLLAHGESFDWGETLGPLFPEVDRHSGGGAVLDDSSCQVEDLSDLRVTTGACRVGAGRVRGTACSRGGAPPGSRSWSNSLLWAAQIRRPSAGPASNELRVDRLDWLSAVLASLGGPPSSNAQVSSSDLQPARLRAVPSTIAGYALVTVPQRRVFAGDCGFVDVPVQCVSRSSRGPFTSLMQVQGGSRRRMWWSSAGTSSGGGSGCGACVCAGQRSAVG